jgi:hypothetical protein
VGFFSIVLLSLYNHKILIPPSIYFLPVGQNLQGRSRKKEGEETQSGKRVITEGSSAIERRKTKIPCHQICDSQRIPTSPHLPTVQDYEATKGINLATLYPAPSSRLTINH